MISPGQKIAKALGIRVIETTEKKTKGIEIAFGFEENGAKTSMTWIGWLTPNAIDNTMKTLVEVLEFNGDEAVVSVPPGDRREGMFVNQDCINRAKEIQLVCEVEQYDGKDRMRIKWVNNVGGGQFAGCTPEVVKGVFASVNFRGAFLAAKQGTSLQQGAPAAPSIMDEPQQQEADLPF